MPTLLTVSWSRDAPPALALDGWARVPSVPSVSRSCALRRPEAAAMADDAAALVRRWASVQPPGGMGGRECVGGFGMEEALPEEMVGRAARIMQCVACMP